LLFSYFYFLILKMTRNFLICLFLLSLVGSMLPSAQGQRGMNRRSSAPSDSPSDVPSDMPSDMPSDIPSDMPSDMSSDMSSDVPSDMPSGIPNFLTFVRLPGAFAPCFLCGEGQVVDKPDKIFAYPGAEPPMTCGKTAEDGLAGLIEEEECQDLKFYAIFICGCKEA
jgi:hypothetical protein